MSLKRFFILLCTTGFIFSCIFLFLPKLEIPSNSKILLDCSGEILCASLSEDEKWRFPIRLEEVPPVYLKMLIAFEDKRFYKHPGVDPFALARGMWQWVKNGCIISGGSTITMQTVRLLKPRPRTIWYKIEEIFQALRLEWRYSKEQILTLYLTLAPYGGNVEGIRAASLTYFQQEPIKLTPAEMALLVVIPQLPTALRPHVYPQKAKAFRDKVLGRLEEKGILTSLQLREAQGDPVPTFRSLFPRHAPHVLEIFKKKYPKQDVYTSTLIKKMQSAAESLLVQETRFFEARQTAAVLVVENESRQIVAYVGSVDPLSEEKNGYVDMVQAVRSPGSALKPFIYALAFEENIIHPETIIDDVSTNFHGYAPTNFRDVFHGEVTIRESLQQSLNIPVVHLLDRLGPGRFMNWLKQFDVHLTFSPKDQLPSLPIALGGVGLRLSELTALYCALANDGQFVPITIEDRTEVPASKALTQPASSWYVTHILEGSPAPIGFVDWFVTAKAPIAFKTGTSYGARDAWCVGYHAGNAGYTVGVWTGRADGSPSPNQLGRTTAAPILLKIFNTILQKESGYKLNLERTVPKGVLNVSGQQLPEPLRWFRPFYTSAALKHSSKRKNNASFKIVSPLADEVYALQKKSSIDSPSVPIPIKIRGGKPPYMFLVNGSPTPLEIQIESSQTQHTTGLWRPSKTGFFELSLIDQDGKSDQVTIQLQ